MGEPTINSKIGHEKQLLFINNERIVGAQSFEKTQNFGISAITFGGIGDKTVYFSPRDEQSATFSIYSLLVNKDQFLSLVTGQQLCNAYILRENNNITNVYSLLSGYFTTYESTYSIGNPASITTTFVALKDAGKIPTGEMSSDSVSNLEFIQTGNFDITGILLPGPGSISLGIDTFNTNRVNSYSINLNVNRAPIYNMGSKFPKRIDFLYPIDVNCSFDFEVGDYENLRLRDFPQNGIIKNLDLTIKDYNTNEIICNYNFNNLNLIGETTKIQVNGNLSVTQTYNGKIFGV